MTTKNGGKPTKDAPISDYFNEKKKGNYSKEELRKIQQRAAMQSGRDKANANKKRLKAEREAGIVPEVVEVDEVVEKFDSGDAKSAYQMLQDLRYAYRNSVGNGRKKGRQRLVDMMKADSEFKFMVKELMKIESSLMAARIRSKEEGVNSNRMVYVVLKGLEDEKLLEKQMNTGIDLKQLERATNPESDLTPYEEEVSQTAAPEMLLGGMHEETKKEEE
jgi:hypothetical protein